MDKTLVLTGAYGRQARLEDWNKGKDFRIVNGNSSTYCSIRDKDLMRQHGWTRIRIVTCPDYEIVHEEVL